MRSEIVDVIFNRDPIPLNCGVERHGSCSTYNPDLTIDNDHWLKASYVVGLFQALGPFEPAGIHGTKDPIGGGDTFSSMDHYLLMSSERLRAFACSDETDANTLLPWKTTGPRNSD